MKKLNYAAFVAAMLVVAVSAQANVITSTFDTGTDGWTVVDINYNTGLGATPVVKAYYPAEWVAGYIYKTDPNLTDTYLFSAPSKFLGAMGSYYGQSISWDLHNYTNGNLEIGLILSGNGHSLYRAGMAGPDGDWLHYNIPLVAGSNWLLDGPNGSPATAGEFAAVLGSLDNIYIMGDYLNGSDTASLDNVSLVPEPATMGLIGLGSLALLRRRRVKI